MPPTKSIALNTNIAIVTAMTVSNIPMMNRLVIDLPHYTSTAEEVS